MRATGEKLKEKKEGGKTCASPKGGGKEGWTGMSRCQENRGAGENRSVSGQSVEKEEGVDKRKR